MDLDRAIAERVAAHRTRLGLTLVALAQRAQVSKSMISKIERGESRPTAVVLGRLASAMGIALAELLTREEPDAGGLVRRLEEQPVWVDPATGYRRRQVGARDAANGSELVEIELPARARVSYPRWEGRPYRQRLWMLAGALTLVYGGETYRLAAGDLMELALDRDVSFEASPRGKCRYLLVTFHV